MPDIAGIEARDRAPCFMVRIAGVPVTFSSVTPPQLSYAYTAEFVGQRAFGTSVSILPSRGLEFSRSLQEDEAIIESDPVSVHMVSRQHLDPADNTDPGYIFGRIGFGSADFYAQLTRSVGHGDNEDIYLSSVAGIQAGDHVHIGRECIEVGAVNVGQKKFTAARRGAIGTLKRKHAVSEADGIYPAVTKPAVFFRGRRALILEGRLGPNGEVPRYSEFVERHRGFIATEPEFSTDGQLNIVKLKIAPMTAILDRPLASKIGPIRLHPTIHTFSENIANNVEIFEKVEQGKYLDMGAVAHFIGATFKSYATQSLPLRLPVTMAGHSPTYTLDKTSHARNVILNRLGHRIASFNTTEQRGAFTVVDADGTPVWTVLDADGNPVFNLDHVPFIGNALAIERRVLPLGLIAHQQAGSWPVSVKWPDVLETAWSGTYDFNGVRISLTSDSLFYGRLKYELSLGTSSVAISPNFGVLDSPLYGPEPKASAVFTGNAKGYIQKLKRDGNGLYAQGKLYYNLNPGENGALFADELDWRGLSGNTIPREVLNFGDQDIDGETEVEITRRFGSTVGDATVDLPVRIAGAYYYTGVRFGGSDSNFEREHYITYESDPDIPAGASLQMSIYLGDSDERAGTMTIGPAVSIVVDGDQAYRCPVYDVQIFSDEIKEAITDDGGAVKNRPKFVPGVQFDTNDSLGEVLLRLLLSSDGQSVSDATFDDLAIGAGLTSFDRDGFGSDVDVGSFLAIEDPGQLNFRPEVTSGSTIYEAVANAMLIAGYALDMSVSSNGACRLTAVRIGIPNASDIRGSIVNADIAARPVPASPSRGVIRNVFTFNANYDLEGNSTLSQTIKDTVSIDTFADADEMTIDLKGATIPPSSVAASLQGIFSRLRVELAYPRRLFRFNVRSGLAALMQIGGAYQITSDQLRGVTSPGVSGIVCRLRSVQAVGWGPTSQVEFIYYGYAGAGWGPTTGITNANAAVLTVTESAFRPDDSVEDASGFTPLAAGDAVRIIDGQDPGAGQHRTVVAVSTVTNTITLDADPGIAAPTDGHPYWGYVVPALRQDASDAHENYGWIGVTRLT